MSTCTVYATIGNSDDKLSQARWSNFAAEFVETIRIQADEIHGVWWSEPSSPWQNCCVGFSIKDEVLPLGSDAPSADRGKDRLRLLQESLTRLREHYGQEAVAWVRGYPPEMI
ncbi:hypothetical protein [Actinophytocola sp.]|uniref:hypothetical protein n=1 Tax=Actinophytocola sp. TaxID=1872138 RepID=UPI002D7F7F5F|nr:hypothetical protein [Actinophytocola sp.]HET9144180.1 hypothetical protein [Actinophytocola sp.]